MPYHAAMVAAASEILVVDDDRGLVEFVTVTLRRAGFSVSRAFDAPSVHRRLQEAVEPDLILLDINLGAWNGFDILKEIRARSTVPVILLTGRGSEEDKVVGLDYGADDYVTKPFASRELLARIRANIRRTRTNVEAAAAAPEASRLVAGPLVLDVETHAVTKNGEPVKVTVTEFKLLHTLMQAKGTVVPTRVLLRKVWWHDDSDAADIVRVTVHRLRRKVEDDPSNPTILRTVPGVGVMCADPDRE